MNAGYSFLGTVFAAGLIGFAIDKFFDVAPWGIMSFLIIGFVSATFQAQRAMQMQGDEKPAIESEKKDDKKA